MFVVFNIDTFEILYQGTELACIDYLHTQEDNSLLVVTDIYGFLTFKSDEKSRTHRVYYNYGLEPTSVYRGTEQACYDFIRQTIPLVNHNRYSVVAI